MSQSFNSQLQDIPLERLRELSRRLSGELDNDGSSSSEYEASTNVSFRPVPADKARLNKGRKKPFEFSSKAPVAPPSHAASQKRKESDVRDPRFSELSGKLNVDLFRKSFGFLDGLQQHEKQELQERLRKPKRPLNEAQKGRLKKQLDRLTALENHRKRLFVEQGVKREFIKKEKENILATGKLPFFPTKARIKQAMQGRKFDELSSSGKLNQHLVKVRKRQAAKDRAFFPATRRRTENKEDP